jgi:signal transduction histidine kinase
VFALDVWLPPGYAVPVLYVGVILASLWIARPPFLLQYAVAATLLAVLGVLPLEGADEAIALFNRGTSIAALWVTAGGIALFRRAVAERRLAETHLRDAAAMAELGKLAAAVAHDVRNALTGVIASLELLSPSDRPDDWAAPVLGQVVRRLDALNDTVDDLLAFADTREPIRTAVSLPDLVTTAVTRLRRRLRSDEPGIVVDVPDVVLDGDADQLGRVVFSLLLNAAQAAPSDAISVGARVLGRRCRLEIVDRGPGIPATIHARLFEPFFSTKGHGVGLGLAHARRVVTAHGGSIEIENAPRGGAAAVIELPCRPTTAPP